MLSIFIFLLLKKDATCLHFIQFVFCSQYRDCFRYLHREHVITEHKGEVWNKYLSPCRENEKQRGTTFFYSEKAFFNSVMEVSFHILPLKVSHFLYNLLVMQ